MDRQYLNLRLMIRITQRSTVSDGEFAGVQYRVCLRLRRELQQNALGA